MSKSHIPFDTINAAALAQLPSPVQPREEANDRRPIISIPRAIEPLTQQSRWVVWRWIRTNGRLTKPPFRADRPDANANSTAPATWCDFSVAMRAYADGRADGIGFALQGSGLGAFDVDDCRNKETGELHPWAQALIARCGTYSEITPSSGGIRIIGTASGPKLHRKLPVTDEVSCELYRSCERFICVTGNELAPAVEQLANIDTILDEVLAELKGAKQANSKGAARNARREHDLNSLIEDGCGNDFGGDRSRAVWYVVNQLLKQGRAPDEIVPLLLDRSNGISAHIYDQPKPEQYARKQVEKAQRNRADGTKKNKQKKTQAGTLIELASSAELYRDRDDVGYARFDANDHKENWPIRSKGFKRVWVTACEGALWKEGTFMKAYAGNIQDAVETVLGNDQVAPVLRAYMDATPGDFVGNATALLKALNGIASDTQQKAEGYPKSPAVLSKTLRRIAPPLRKIGINITFPDRTKKLRSITIALVKVSETPSLLSPPSSSNSDNELEKAPYRHRTVTDEEATVTGDGSDSGGDSSAGAAVTSNMLKHKGNDGSDGSDGIFPNLAGELNPTPPYVFSSRAVDQLACEASGLKIDSAEDRRGAIHDRLTKAGVPEELIDGVVERVIQRVEELDGAKSTTVDPLAQAGGAPAHSPPRPRPPLWTDHADEPKPGDRCEVCGGNVFATRVFGLHPWMCKTCHPPAGPGYREVRT